MPAFVKKFSKCDSISTIRRLVDNGTNATGGFVDTISIVDICVHRQTQWWASTIYEDKGA